MSNLNGGTITEVNLVTLVAPVCVAALMWLCQANRDGQASVLLWSCLQAKQSTFTPYGPLACFIDLLLNAIAILFATTLYSSALLPLNAALLAPALCLALLGTRNYDRGKRVRKSTSIDGQTTTDKNAGLDLPQKPFITAYRGTMMVVTCVAILAVDFRVFPRRFAKVENWGTSLMDMGVGSFVFSAGTIAARPILKQQAIGLTTSTRARLKASARHSAPLLVMGLIRLYTVKGLDYAEHVTEYGVHWNFFFTLAFISPFVAVFDTVFSVVPSYSALAMLIAAMYEVILSTTSLKKFIISAPRVDLLSQNREGLCSLFGYLAIFLAGQSTGMYALPRRSTKGRASDRTQLSTLYSFVRWATTWWVLFWLSTDYSYGFNLQVSRRIANLPYVLWVAAFNTSQLALFCAIEFLTFPTLYNSGGTTTERLRCKEATSPLLHALNRNGLAIFLLANLLTGLVNLTLPTLSMSNLQAMGVLTTYTTALSAVALLLDRFNMSIKF